MKSRTHSMLLAGLAVAALAVPLTIQNVGAQDAPQNPPQRQGGQAGPGAQRGGQQGQGQGFPGQPGQGGFGGGQMGMMMGGGGAPTMVVDGQFLYILRGNQLLKVQKETLKVVAQGELPMPEGRGGPGGEFQPQRRGGAGAPPPPPPPSAE